MTKPIKTRKKLLLFLAILYLFLGLFFTLAGCVSGNLLCFLLSCIIFFPASILLFVQLFLLGKKNFVYRRRYLYPSSISASIYSFLDRNRMSDACRSAGSFKF